MRQRTARLSLAAAFALLAACATSPQLRADRHMDRATTLLEKGKPGPAALEYRRAAQADPSRAEASLMSGVAFYRAALAGGAPDQLDAAVEALRKAVETAPKDGPARLALAIALNEKGIKDEALDHFARALELEPRFTADLRLESALIERDLMRSPSAAPWAARHAALASESSRLRAHLTKANALLVEAETLRAQGGPSAVAKYKKALELNPRLIAAYCGLGLALMDQGRSGPALNALRRGVELGPRDALAHASLGRGLLGFHIRTSDPGSLAGALESLERAAEMDPKIGWIQADLGKALRLKAAKDKSALARSVAAWRRAIALEPGRGSHRAGLGEALAASGKVDEAVTAYRMAVDLDPEDGAAYQGLGEALALNGELDDAIVQYKRAVVRRPKEALWHVLLGDLYARKGKHEKAADLYQEALKLGGDDPQVHFSLGMAFKKSGQRREAALSLKRFLDKGGPSAPKVDLDQARKALKELEGTP